MGRVEGKVAFITGAARGQGRSHAVRLAEEGASIIAADICADLPGVSYPMGTEAELAETASLIEERGRPVVTRIADVRDSAALDGALKAGVERFGRLDVVCANAGANVTPTPAHLMDERAWNTSIDVNLTGVWRTCKAAIPYLLEGERGGSIIITSSTCGLRGCENGAHYSSAKHGVIGLMEVLAKELAGQMIRVNAVNPTQVPTAMIMHEEMYRLFCPDLEAPGPEAFAVASQRTNLFPIPWVEARDVSDAVLFLASEESRFITGACLPVSAGAQIK